MSARAQTKTMTRVLCDNPLEGESLLRDALFVEPKRAAEPVVRAPKPRHYKVVSISLYTEDIERLDRMVAELKRRGHYKANKSQLIRLALARLDINRLPDADRAPALFCGEPWALAPR